MSDEAWDAVWWFVGTTIDPPPPELERAAWLYDRDGYLGLEARHLCAMYRAPLDFGIA